MGSNSVNTIALYFALLKKQAMVDILTVSSVKTQLIYCQL